MKKLTYCGVSISDLKKVLKADQKKNDSRIRWEEADGFTYYCNGHFIVRWLAPFLEVAEVFGLGVKDMPAASKTPGLPAVFGSFRASEYHEAKITPWKMVVGSRDVQVVADECDAAAIDTDYLSIFAFTKVELKNRLGGIRCTHSDSMVAYVLPVRTEDNTLPVLTAICKTSMPA